MKRTLSIYYVRPHLWWLPFSLLVRWFTKSEISHVGVSFGNGYIVDASGTKGVAITRTDKWFERYKVIDQAEIPLNEEEFIKASRFVRGNLNKDYSFMQILSMALFILGITKKPRWGNGKKEYICSELVVRMLLSIGIRLTNRPADFISPRRLRGLLHIYLTHNVHSLVDDSSDTDGPT